MVESAGTAPAASILQGSIAPLCTPQEHDPEKCGAVFRKDHAHFVGVQGQCRPDLPGISNRCFHWISFLDGERRDARLRKGMIRKSALRFSERSCSNKNGADSGSRTRAAGVAHRPTTVIFCPQRWWVTA